MLHVLKATGEREPFSENKLYNSIQRAGVPKDLQDQAVAHVKDLLYDDIPTSKIYHHVSEFLSKSSHPYANSKYTLKNAIMELGPTGYPFEDFAARVLGTFGYQTQVRQVLMGKCVSHEVDIIAKKDTSTIIFEAKFHNKNGIKTDVQVALYTQARFQDLREKHMFTSCGLITNTKLTTDAIAYAECMNMSILSWNYPNEGSLRDIVEKEQLFPITALTTLPTASKEQLLSQGVVLISELCKNPQLLDTLGLNGETKKRIQEDALFVCHR